jgi:hypothetical protein
MERGSERFNSSKIGSDSGTGSFVQIVRYLVLTDGTATGVRSYSAMFFLQLAVSSEQ